MMPSHSKSTPEQAFPPKRRKAWLEQLWSVEKGMSESHSSGATNVAELLDSVPVFLWQSDENGLYTYFNRSWLEFRGRSLEEEKGLGWIEGIHPDDVKKILDIHAEASTKQKPFTRKFQLKGKDQKYYWMRDSANPVYVGETFAGYCGSTMDFTLEQENEENLRRSLHEKETLLKEAHHRIKNNLQILGSLLSLQRQQNDNEEVGAILRECQNRVHVIVLLHMKLFEIHHLDRLNFAEYVKELAQIILDSYMSDRNKISLRLELESLPMHPDKVIPCGLILNELLSNAAKHAFPGQEQGEVTVRFFADKEDYCLEIVDGGIGFSEEVPAKGSKTLGLRLVSTLARQLGGELTVERNSGTIARVRFLRCS